MVRPKKRRGSRRATRCRIGRRISKYGKKIKGTFCEATQTPLRAFDRRSFRWKRSRRGRAWLLIGCPKYSWQPQKNTCSTGTKVHKILRRVT